MNDAPLSNKPNPATSEETIAKVRLILRGDRTLTLKFLLLVKCISKERVHDKLLVDMSI